MKQLSSLLAIFALLLLISACSTDKQIREEWTARIHSIQAAYVPDRTLEVFDVQLNKQGSQWLVQGETSKPAAKQAVLHLADSLFGHSAYQENLRLLPDASLGDSIYALVNLAVTPLRRQPRHAAEMVDQVILGHQVKLLKQEKSWYLVQTEYGYLGWISGYAFARLNLSGLKAWTESPLARVTALFTEIYRRPDVQAEALASAVLNVHLKLIKRGRKWSKVQLPAGDEGYIPTAHIAPFQGNVDGQQLTAEAIIATAKRMLGIPYLWGGNSSVGNDCSGFTQTVFEANGLLLPRDARQQAIVGKKIVPEKDFSNVRPADLLFFGSGKNITHVGISLGGYDFIHQDSDVHVNSFDSTAANYNKYRTRTLKKIMRIINR